jgi:hypothetical protein
MMSTGQLKEGRGGDDQHECDDVQGDSDRAAGDTRAVQDTLSHVIFCACTLMTLMAFRISVPCLTCKQHHYFTKEH